MEGHWETPAAALVLFGIPDQEGRGTRRDCDPALGGLILKHDLNGRYPSEGLSKQDRPPVLPVFFAFRIMAALVFCWSPWLTGAFLWKRGTLFTTRCI